MERSNAIREQKEYLGSSGDNEQRSNIFTGGKEVSPMMNVISNVGNLNLAKTLFEIVKEGHLQKISNFICTPLL